MEAPKRRYELTLTLGADDIETIQRSLRQISFDLERNRVNEEPYNSVSGGYDSGWTLDLKFNPGVTHDSYIEALEAYLAEKKA